MWPKVESSLERGFAYGPACTLPGIWRVCQTYVMADPEEVRLEVQTDPAMLGGVYANLAVVNHSPYEFTLDFIRVDYTSGGSRGVLVSRVNMSPLFVRSLIDALEKNWESYAEKAGPSEVS